MDRIWPRGLTTARVALGEWCKDIAPSAELRKWYNHDPDRFEDFSRHYEAELNNPIGPRRWRTCPSLRSSGS